MRLASILDQYHDAFQSKYGSRLLPGHRVLSATQSKLKKNDNASKEIGGRKIVFSRHADGSAGKGGLQDSEIRQRPIRPHLGLRPVFQNRTGKNREPMRHGESPAMVSL
jgi:hypothetical protein